MTETTARIDVGGAIEYRLEPAEAGAQHLSPLVFLHEGLGSVALWREFTGHRYGDA